MSDIKLNAELAEETISVETIQGAQFWMDALDCNEDELRLAVRVAGHTVADVQAYLDKARSVANTSRPPAS